MEFTNTFDIDAPLERVWVFMLNAQEVAPCVPGAAITEIVDDSHYKGTVKVKLGAVQVAYRGELELQPNESARTIVLKAKGTEQRGSGGASALVTTTLTETGDGTHVDIHSQIDVTGKVATFGRGIMQDVANKLIREFSACLEKKLLAANPAPEAHPEAGAQAEESVGTSTEVQSAGTSKEVHATPAQSVPAAPAYVPAKEVVELRLSGLMLAILRGRVAAGLRALATLVEPK
jgi:carbon monoxide dehydrogenase subunit G